MNRQPKLVTQRLTLRPFEPSDAPRVQELASAREIAYNTLVVPHPYPEGEAERWIATHRDDFQQNRIHHFALDDGDLVGAMALMMKNECVAELGYWIGLPYWGRGYATEAAREIVRYGFEQCGLQRVFAGHYTRNPASGRVLQKIGMQHEGTQRRHVLKWGEYLDMALYGILREEWESLD